MTTYFGRKIERALIMIAPWVRVTAQNEFVGNPITNVNRDPSNR